MKNTEEKENFQEKSNINLDKMVFKFTDESELRELLSKRKTKFNTEDVLEIGKKISEQYKEIKIEVEKRLSTLLPDFEAKEFEVLFTSYEWADFRCPNDNEVVVDLVRLSKSPSVMETLIAGITHEVFHVWFYHQPFVEKSNIHHEIVDNNKVKVLLRSLDEGLAVNISGQNLEDFYKTRLNKEYNIKLAFDNFNKFLKISDEKDIEKIVKEGFQSMGFFYVVGYEIVKAIGFHQGVDFVKKVLADSDFLEIFEKYEEICKSDDNLPKIDFVALRKIIKK